MTKEALTYIDEQQTFANALVFGLAFAMIVLSLLYIGLQIKLSGETKKETE